MSDADGSDPALDVPSYMTYDEAQLINVVSIAGACVSIFLCLVVFILIGWCWSVKEARHRLNRISFRLLVWALGFELLYDATYIASCLGDQSGPGCVAGLYALEALLAIVNYLCTCIGINLACTIVLGINPIQLKLERWYIGVSLAIGLFIPLFPAALGHFGYDPIFDICWYTAADSRTRFRWLLFDLYFWQILSSAMASIAVIATLVTLFMSGRATARAIFIKKPRHNHAHTHDHEHTHDHGSGAGHDVEKQGHGIGNGGHLFFSRLRHCRECKQDRGGIGQIRGTTAGMGQLQDKFIRIALRISMYPIALILSNTLMSVGDLYIASRGGVQNQSDYILYFAYEVLYGARGIFFGALALCDPCLIKGVRDAWRYRHNTFRRRTESSSDPNAPRTGPVESTTPILVSSAVLDEKPPVPGSALDHRPSAGSMDMFNALSLPMDVEEPPVSPWGAVVGGAAAGLAFSTGLVGASPEPRRISLPRLWIRRWSARNSNGSSNSSGAGVIFGRRFSARSEEYKGDENMFTRSFAGVPMTNLPLGMTDEVDVDVEAALATTGDGDVVVPVLLDSECIDPMSTVPNSPILPSTSGVTTTPLALSSAVLGHNDLPTSPALSTASPASPTPIPSAIASVEDEKKSPQPSRRGSTLSLQLPHLTSTPQQLSVTFVPQQADRPRVRIHDYYARSRADRERESGQDRARGRGRGRGRTATVESEGDAGKGRGRDEVQEQGEVGVMEEGAEPAEERGRSREREKYADIGRGRSSHRSSQGHSHGHGHGHGRKHSDGTSGRGRTMERGKSRDRGKSKDRDGKKVDELDEEERKAFEDVQALL